MLYLFHGNLVVRLLLLLGVSHLADRHLWEQLRLVGHLFLAALRGHYFTLILLNGIQLWFGLQLRMPLLPVSSDRDQLVCHDRCSIIIQVRGCFDFEADLGLWLNLILPDRCRCAYLPHALIPTIDNRLHLWNWLAVELAWLAFVDRLCETEIVPVISWVLTLDHVLRKGESTRLLLAQRLLRVSLV